MNHRYEVGVPLHVHLQPLQPGVHQEDDQQDGVDDGEAGEEVGEGGGDVVAGEDDDGDGVGQDSQDTETGEENSLERQDVTMWPVWSSLASPRYKSCISPRRRSR